MSNTWEQRYLRGSYEEICKLSRKLKNIPHSDANTLCGLINNARYYYQQSDIISYNATLTNYIRIAENSTHPFIAFTGSGVEIAAIGLD
jgi:hypothetical protein